MFKNTAEREEFRTAKSRQTHERVVQAAIRCLVRDGYDGTTMRDLAKESGMSLGAFYYYFRSKEEIVLAFYETVNEEVADRFETLPQSGSAGAALGRFLRLKLEILRPYRNLMRILIKEAVDPQSPISPLSEATEGTRLRSTAIFERILGSRVPLQEVRARARLLWAAHMALLAYWLHDRSEAQTHTDRAIDLLCRLVDLGSVLDRLPGAGRVRQEVYALLEAIFPAARPEAS